MTISYPLAMPVHTGIAGVSFRMVNTTALSESPFTGKQQLQAYPRQRWEADVTLPSMLRDDAEEWTAWLSSLRGRYGTFLLGDPMGVDARGSARGSAVNNITYSEQLDNAAWIKTQCTVGANYAYAPNGSLTADFLVANTTVSQHYAQSPSLSLVTGTKYVASIYLKAGAQTSAQVSLGGLITGYPILNLLTGVITGTHVGAYSVNAGNGWWRFVFPGVASSTGAPRFIVWPKDLASAAGDGTSGIYVWGVQFEAGDVVTDYQAIAASYAPAVNGAGQTGNTLAIKGASPSQIGFLMPGDYIQLGTTANARLFKVLTRVDTDASGNGTVDIWPNLRTSPADSNPVVVNGAKGLFRLMSDESSWNTNAASVYGVSFTAMEAY